MNVCMFACISINSREVWGHAPPREIRCSEIASEAILGTCKSGAVVATWLAGYCIQPVLAVLIYAFGKPGDVEVPQEKVLRLAEQQVAMW